MISNIFVRYILLCLEKFYLDEIIVRYYDLTENYNSSELGYCFEYYLIFMKTESLTDIIYDLEAGVSKILDQIYELMSAFDTTLLFNDLSLHLQQIHLSTIKTLYLTGVSLSEQLELKITHTFTQFKLLGKPFRKLTYSLKILSDLSEVCYHIYEAHIVLLKIKAPSEEYLALRDLWIKAIRNNLGKMLHLFLKIYSRKALDLNGVGDEISSLNILEFECNKIYNEHTPSVINMSKTSLISISEAFYFTSVIRYLERAADIVYEMIFYAYNTHTSDLSYLFSLKDKDQSSIVNDYNRNYSGLRI